MVVWLRERLRCVVMYLVQQVMLLVWHLRLEKMEWL
jgi:hypothetical protein